MYVAAVLRGRLVHAIYRDVEQTKIMRLVQRKDRVITKYGYIRVVFIDYHRKMGRISHT